MTMYAVECDGIGYTAEKLAEILRAHEARAAVEQASSDHCRMHGCVHAAHGCPTWAAGANPFAAEQAEALRQFALAVLGDWPEGAPDGGELQDIATKHGLLVAVPTTVPCGENCICAEYYDEGDNIGCLHRAPFLISAARGK